MDVLPLIKDDKKREKILKSLPKTFGIYLMKDNKDNVIYIGKAKNLSSRVRHYFQSSKNHSIGTRVMMPKIFNIETISVSSELEALLLEINQIKKYKPKYNVLMKDDKNYVYLKITINEDYPRIFPSRFKEKDKALYFGPYMSIKKVEASLDIVKKIFPYRTCKGSINWIASGEDISTDINQGELALYKKNVECKGIGRNIPCLEYHIKRCTAPCLGIVSKEEYLSNITNIVSFLKGDFNKVVSYIKEMMKEAVSERKFEWAAKLRDQLKHIEDLKEKQRVVSVEEIDQDVIAIVSRDNLAVATLIQIRSGKLIQILHRELSIQKDSEISEVFERFILDYYKLTSDFPKQILLASEIDSLVLEDWFLKECNEKIKIFLPQKGKKKDLINLAIQNAEQYIESKKASFEESSEELGLKELKEIFSLKNLPKRIECYDISHIQGTNTVASMVVLKDGKTDSSLYRRFQVKTLEEGMVDDYQSMREVLSRRLKYLQDSSFNISTKKASKSILKEYIEGKYPKEECEKLDWFYSASDKNTIIFGVDIIDDTVAIISRYKVIDKVSEDLKQEMFLSLLYKLKQSHIYIDTINKELGTFLSFGAVEVPVIPEKYNSLKLFGDTVLSWYKKTKNRKSKDDSFSKVPDILVVDGGKGQLSTVYKVMKELGLDIFIIGLAKEEEEIFIPNTKKSIKLETNSLALRLIVRARDESHRFANTFHREKREKDMVKSELDSIPGIGKSTKMTLLKTFGSVEEIRKAPLETIEEYVGKRIAKIIECYLK